MGKTDIFHTFLELIHKYSLPLLAGIPVALIFANVNYGDYQA